MKTCNTLNSCSFQWTLCLQQALWTPLFFYKRTFFSFVFWSCLWFTIRPHVPDYNFLFLMSKSILLEKYLAICLRSTTYTHTWMHIGMHSTAHHMQPKYAILWEHCKMHGKYCTEAGVVVSVHAPSRQEYILLHWAVYYWKVIFTALDEWGFLSGLVSVILYAAWINKGWISRLQSNDIYDKANIQCLRDFSSMISILGQS